MFPKSLSHPPTYEFLNQLKSNLILKQQADDFSYLITAVTATTLGHAQSWIPTIYAHAISSDSRPNLHSNSIPNQQPQTGSPSQNKLIIFQQIKEALLKSSILIGVPKSIEASMILKQTGIDHEIRDDSFFREKHLDLSVRELLELGDRGLRRVYHDDLVGIFDMFGDDLNDIKFISRAVTYGMFLSSVHPNNPLTAKQTQVVILSALIAQRAHREILWHLRGSMRNGFEPDQIESIQSAIESVCHKCGLTDHAEGLPRISDLQDISTRE